MSAERRILILEHDRSFKYCNDECILVIYLQTMYEKGRITGRECLADHFLSFEFLFNLISVPCNNRGIHCLVFASVPTLFLLSPFLLPDPSSLA